MKQRQKNKILNSKFRKAAEEKAAFLSQYRDDVKVEKIEERVGYRVIVKHAQKTTVHLIDKDAPYTSMTWRDEDLA